MPQSSSSGTTSHPPSRVLLLLIFDTIALSLTNQTIHSKFAKFGPISRILIFQRGEVSKVFVEFEELNHAVQARKQMDGTKLMGAIGKMCVYFSTFKEVDLRNETSQGADFRLQEQFNKNYVQKYETLSQSFNTPYFQQHYPSPFTPFSRSKTDEPKHLSHAISQMRVQPKSMIHEEDELEQMISNGIFSLIQERDIKDRSENTEQSLKPKEQDKSAVLGFEMVRDIPIKSVYNLFSNFGNISFITKKPPYIYIKFRSPQFCQIAMTYLSNYSLHSSPLLLVACTSSQAFPSESEFCQCIFYDNSSDRFTENRGITINAPSQTLHVSSIKKEICQERALKDIFGKYGRLEGIRILYQSQQKNMALVKFSCIEDSFEAVANLHNSVFSGRKMQISFTKSKI